MKRQKKQPAQARPLLHRRYVQDWQIRGILFSRFNPRANISKQIKELIEQLSAYILAPIYKTAIRSAVAVEEAQANKTEIYIFCFLCK